MGRRSQGGVKRFIYASSSSIYGVKAEANVTEESEPEPLTDYSKYKAGLRADAAGIPQTCAAWQCVIIRPATVCGYAPRLRLDLVGQHPDHARPGEPQDQVSSAASRCGPTSASTTWWRLPDSPGGPRPPGGQRGLQRRLSTITPSRSWLIWCAMRRPTRESPSSRCHPTITVPITSIRTRFVARWDLPLSTASRTLSATWPTPSAAARCSDPLTNPLYYNIKTMQRLKVS